VATGAPTNPLLDLASLTCAAAATCPRVEADVTCNLSRSRRGVPPRDGRPHLHHLLERRQSRSRKQDAASRLKAAAAEDVLGLADIGADVPGDSPELQTRTRARAGGARGDGAWEDGAGSCVRAGGEEEEEGPAFIGQETFSPARSHPLVPVRGWNRD
jgi:hypothetical protein